MSHVPTVEAKSQVIEIAKGIPRNTKSDIAPLTARRLKNVPLVGIGAFIATNTRKNEKTGEEDERTQIKLSLDWDSGYPIRDTDGELVTDEEGHGRPHLINDGFVTFSGDKRSNFVKILRAMGFGDDYFDDDGNLSDDMAETVEAVFGTNGLGDDYSGAEWDDLPEYILPSKGGKEAKRDVEVPVLSLKINGYELLGRCVDMALTIKDGFTKAESYLLPEDFVDLDTPVTPVVSMSLGEPSQATKQRAAAAKRQPTKGTPKTRKGVPQDETETAAVFGDSVDPENEPTPFDPAPTSKRSIYVTRALQTAGIPGKDRIAFLAWLLEDEDVTSIANISLGAAQQFRAMAEGPDANGDSGGYLRRQFVEYQSMLRNPHLHQSDDDFGDEDDDEDWE